jgi:hypothetical protein
LPLLLVLLSTMPLVITTLWLLDLLEETHEAATLESMQALAQAKAEAIEQFTEDRAGDVERIAQLISENVAQAQATAAQQSAPEPEQLPVLKDAEALPIPQPPRDEAEHGPPDAGQTSPPEESSGPAPAPPAVKPSGKLEEAVNGLRQQLGLIQWDQQKFEELLVISADGRVLVSTFSEHEGRTAADLA